MEIHHIDDDMISRERKSLYRKQLSHAEHLQTGAALITSIFIKATIATPRRNTRRASVVC
jgi:hypothetical protein